MSKNVKVSYFAVYITAAIMIVLSIAKDIYYSSYLKLDEIFLSYYFLGIFIVLLSLAVPLNMRYKFSTAGSAILAIKIAFDIYNFHIFYIEAGGLVAGFYEGDGLSILLAVWSALIFFAHSIFCIIEFISPGNSGDMA